MSYTTAPQTVRSKNTSDILKDLRKVLRCMGNKFIAEVDYGVGEGYSREEYIEVKYYMEVLESEYCDIEKHKEDIKNLVKIKLAKHGM